MVIKAINASNMALTSKLGLYSAILSTYKHDDNGIRNNGHVLYREEFTKIAKLIKDKTENQQKSKHEISSWVSKQEIEEGNDKLLKKALKSGDAKDFLNHLIFNLFTLLPPRRAIDYSAMMINEEENYKGNVVITKKNKKFDKFIFNTFKLSERKGREIFDRKYIASLPRGNEILELLDCWLGINKSDYFLESPYSANAMTKKVIRISTHALGKPVNINVMRHIYITDFMKDSPYFNEREKIANYMSQGVNMQELYRKKPEELKGIIIEDNNNV